MAKFKIGDKATPIKNFGNKIGGSIKKGDILTIMNVEKCSCGAVYVDVGLRFDIGVNKCRCGAIDSTSRESNVSESCLEKIIETRESFKEVEYEKVFKELTMPAGVN